MYSFFPPVGLEYVAAAAAQIVPEVRIYDLRYEKKPPGGLERFDALGVSINWKYEFEDVCRIVRSLPAGTPVIIGGRTATDRAGEILSQLPNVAAVVCGDGHEAIRELAQARQ
jgi:radical SAM superfamily enzyme YgiQ (UPF0313 family)